MRSLVALLLIFSCAKTPAPPSTPASPSAPLAPPQTSEATGPRVIFPDGFVVSVEIANDDELRAQGLMYRDHLRPGTGMLFFFPEDGVYAFWMKNTRIPLDMVWIDASQRVAHVKYNVPPCVTSSCPSYDPVVPARYVLEVAGGVAQQHGIKAGDQLRFLQTEGVVAR